MKGHLKLLDPLVAAQVCTESELNAIAPDLLLVVREFVAHMAEHPLDMRPMYEAKTRGDIDDAARKAFQCGFKLGREIGICGLDAIKGRLFLDRMVDARRKRREKTGSRHDHWQDLANDIWRENPNRTTGWVAGKVLDALWQEGKDAEEPVKVPTLKTIRNKIRKNRK